VEGLPCRPFFFTMNHSPRKTVKSQVDSMRKQFTKRDLLEACRKISPTKESAIQHLKRKTPRISRQNTRSADPDAGSQIRVLDAGVKLSAKKMNECKAHADRLEDELKKKNDELIEIARETYALDEMINGNNPEAKRIHILEKEIEDVHIQADSKLHYRLKLNHMHHRFQKNSLTLDAHLSAMSDTLNAAEKDKQKCEKMMGDIESAQAKAIKDLERTIREVETERSHRERTLSSRKNEALNAEKMEAWREERLLITTELNSSFGEGKMKENKEQCRRLIKEIKADLSKLNLDMEEKGNSLAQMEEAFMQIKQATGVNEVTELVDKITNHEEQRARLQTEKKEAEDKLASAKSRLEEAQQEYDELRAHGIGNTELNRSTISDINEEILREKTAAKVTKSTNARLENVLVEIRQGGMGLYQRLLAYHPTLLDGEAPTLGESATTSTVQAAYDTLEMLKVTEQILSKMLNAIGGVGIFRYSKHFENDGNGNDEQDSISHDLERTNLHENNCRIEVRSRKQSIHSELVVDEDENDDEKIDEVQENCIPTRTLIKEHSEQQAEEARRQAELEAERHRKLKCGTSENLDNKAEMKQRQSIANDRMAKHAVPIGLPKALTIRDDPMRKAQVFLTEMPCLD